MKILIYGLLTFIMIIAFASCSNEKESTDNASYNNVTDFKEAENSEALTSTETIDIDLTKLSSTMVYAEVYNMMVSPDDYVGKTVKMNGLFTAFYNKITDKYSFACIIADAAGCCTQGIEFVWKGIHTYPEDYPELGLEIHVIGTFDMYEESGNKYGRLINADLTY